VIPERDPAAGVVVIGYGNRLRSDDGLGWHAIERLSTDPRAFGSELLFCHQLAPELSIDIGRASLVILVDADADLEPGAVAVREVVARAESGTLMSHHIDPGTLLALTVELTGAAPAVYTVSAGPESMETGDRLSAAAERALPDVVERVAELIAGKRLA
jgi:hydrogenase maturation protease